MAKLRKRQANEARSARSLQHRKEVSARRFLAATLAGWLVCSALLVLEAIPFSPKLTYVIGVGWFFALGVFGIVQRTWFLMRDRKCSVVAACIAVAATGLLFGVMANVNDLAMTIGEVWRFSIDRCLQVITLPAWVSVRPIQMPVEEILGFNGLVVFTCVTLFDAAWIGITAPLARMLTRALGMWLVQYRLTVGVFGLSLAPKMRSKSCACARCCRRRERPGSKARRHSQLAARKRP